MAHTSLYLFTTFCVLQLSWQESALEPGCKNNPGTSRTLKLSVNSKKNQTGEWVDTFTARTESGNSSDMMQLDISHTVTECEGKRILLLEGVAKAPKFVETYESLRFHTRCGKNVAIMNGGRTVQKINLDDPLNSVVFTNRPLRDNEIFELKLEKKNSKYQYSIGIGVMTRTPTDVDLLPEMYKSPVSWLYHHPHIYSNGAEVLKNYGKDLNQLQVGDRVGVMRSEYGNIHFVVNGVDQGPAISSVPSPVYGIFELWYNAAKASIVDVSSPSK